MNYCLCSLGQYGFINRVYSDFKTCKPKEKQESSSSLEKQLYPSEGGFNLQRVVGHVNCAHYNYKNLGSGNTGSTLEDYFVLFHHNILAAVLLSSQKSPLQIEPLPSELALNANN
jgi:hypothetical protein